MEGGGSIEDRDIVALYHERSETAIELTDDKYGAYCRVIANRILQNDEDTEECVNEAYLRVWDSVPPQEPRNLRAYLAKIVRNISLNIYKKHHTQKSGRGVIPFLLDELAECVPSMQEIDTLTEDILIRDTLQSFLRSLPKTERQIFMRRYWNMDTVEQIAHAYGMSQNRVSVMLHRTRLKLKATLQKEGIYV